jgi:N-formylglutamate deformylase
LNGRFKGGYITRHYGDPANRVQAVQLELAQRAYMDEATLDIDAVLADRLRDTLRGLLGAFTRTVAVQ